MFESNSGEEGVHFGRRLFLAGACAAVGGAALFSFRRPHLVADAASKEPVEVMIVQFSDSGKRLETVTVTRIVKSEDEWRKQLPSGVFEITRHADTEFAYSGKLLNVHDEGVFRCICCDNALFSSSTMALMPPAICSAVWPPVLLVPIMMTAALGLRWSSSWPSVMRQRT